MVERSFFPFDPTIGEPIHQKSTSAAFS